MAPRRAARSTSRRPVRRRRNHHCGYHPEGDPRAYSSFAAFSRACGSRRRNPSYPWGASLADDAVRLHRMGFEDGHRFALRTNVYGTTRAELVKAFERAAANDKRRRIDASIVVTVTNYYPRRDHAALMRAFMSGVRAGFADVAEMLMDSRRR